MSQDEITRPMTPGSRKLFEALMDQTPDRVYFKDLRSRFLVVSKALAQKHGCQSSDELVGKTDFDFFNEEHAKDAFEDERNIILTGKPVIGKEEREVWGDGSVTWVSTTKVPLFLESGKIAGIMGISRDITQQHRAQAVIQHQNDILSRDLESARQVQKLMIPGRVPDFDGMTVGVSYRPMEAVGGDIIVFPVTPKKFTFFFVGDVCGHGLSAAMYTVLVRHLTDQIAAKYDGDPSEFITSLNKLLIGQFTNRFMSAVSGHFLLEKSGHLSYVAANAGHPAPIIYRKQTRTLETLSFTESLAMGLMDQPSSDTVHGVLDTGDRIFLYTDGIPEILDAYGELSFEQLIRSTIQLSPQHQADSITERVRQIGDEITMEDDLTLAIIEGP
ncbi:SpoIIE family protein phosphatase [Cerasicoccus maritimus]|uniref:SpoIIE family protein phosphatase n=1 Tax=Cerasicoccus maritimus TaxID=490089 RepID=UPI00285280BB|nr:SpoIIE family protein phosphatase [Cerasicoccus maritimus]